GGDAGDGRQGNIFLSGGRQVGAGQAGQLSIVDREGLGVGRAAPGVGDSDAFRTFFLNIGYRYCRRKLGAVHEGGGQIDAIPLHARATDEIGAVDREGEGSSAFGSGRGADRRGRWACDGHGGLSRNVRERAPGLLRLRRERRGLVDTGGGGIRVGN